MSLILLSCSVIVHAQANIPDADTRTNYALDKSSETNIGVKYNGFPKYANDDDESTKAHLRGWWQVDLEQSANIQEITLTGTALTVYGIYVFISDEPFGERTRDQLQADDSVVQYYVPGSHFGKLVIPTDAVGRYVRIDANSRFQNNVIREIGIYDSRSEIVAQETIDLQDGKLFDILGGDVWYNGWPAESIDTDMSNEAIIWRRGGSDFGLQYDLRRVYQFDEIRIYPDQYMPESYLFISKEPFGYRSSSALLSDSNVQAIPIDGQSDETVITLPLNDLEGRYVRIQAPQSWLFKIKELEIDGANLPTDTDGDGIPDDYEIEHGLDITLNDALLDRDGDNISNLREFLLGLSASDAQQLHSELNDQVIERWGLDPYRSLNDQINEVDDYGRDIFGYCDDDKRIIHVLNRLSYGPTAALYKRLKAGTDCAGAEDTQKVENAIYKWVVEQLNSEGITDEAQRRETHAAPQVEFLPGFRTLDEVEADVASGILEDKPYYYARKARPGIEENESYCAEVRLPAQCGYSDPAQCERDVSRFSSLIGNNQYTNGTGMFGIRPLISNQDIRTKLGIFWDNHFNTDVAKGAPRYRAIGPEFYEEDTFFMNAFGNFAEDLVIESAKSSTMMLYLDQNANVFDGNNPANENYARELLELHTLGENSIYDEDDIKALARIMTGFGIIPNPNKHARNRVFAPARDSLGKLNGCSFVYPHSSIQQAHVDENRAVLFDTVIDNSEHDPADKSITLDDVEINVSSSSGFTVNNALVQPNYTNCLPDDNDSTAIEAALCQTVEVIAEHPRSGEFVCGKLAKWLISDNEIANAPAVAACVEAFISNINQSEQVKQMIGRLLGMDYVLGDVSEVSDDAVLDVSAAFNLSANRRAKYKDDYEYTFGFGRLLNAESDFARLAYYVAPLPFNEPSPTGLKEESMNWRSMQSLIARSRFVYNSISVRGYWSKIFRLLPPALNDAALNNENGIDIDKRLVGYLLMTMFGGEYDANDVVLAYNILNTKNGSVSDLNFYLSGTRYSYSIHNNNMGSIIALLSAFASHYKYHLN